MINNSSNQQSQEVWQKILQILDEKLQYGLLEQAKMVVDVSLEDTELTITVANQEAERFFSNEQNQQRLIIQSRPDVKLSKVKVLRVESSPIG